MLRCPPGLTVDHPIGRQILHELAGDATQLGGRLHHRDGVLEHLQVPDKGAGVSGLGKPPAEIIRIRGGELVSDLPR